MSDAPSNPGSTAEVAFPTLGERLVGFARRAAVAGALALVACAVAIGAWIGPYVLDDQKLDTIVMAVALDWRDFGLDRARERLQYELDHQAIGTQIGDETCAFDDEGEGGRRISCAWGVDLDVPLAQARLPLRFGSRAVVTASGDLQ